MIRVCFVCLGNICRSPIAEGIFRQRVTQEGLGARIAVDSAGTAGYHVGERADRRARAAAKRRGIELESLARKFDAVDFEGFDYVVAMDRDNLADLADLTRCPQEQKKLSLLRSFDGNAPADAEVPDPYYGGPEGFDEVIDMCQVACRGLLDHIKLEHDVS